MPLSSKRPHHLPCSPIKVEAPITQGIVAVLDHSEKSKSPSIRRTLSADMSSKKWLEQNGLLLSPLKKIASSEQMAFSSDSSSSFSSEGEEEFDKRPGQDEVWRSIQLEKEKNVVEKPKADVWGSLILSQKSENCDSNALPPPYVHPLVKRSSSILSEKSLEICTESLGSETGSDVFSSYPASEVSVDGDEEKEETQREFVQEEVKEVNPFEDLHVPKYKVSPARPFPPPIRSIGGGDGAGLHMHSHRENGRLVLEAVSVPPRNYFQAQRMDGRLVLTLISGSVSLESDDENKVEEFEEVFDKMEEFDEKIEEDKIYDCDEEEEEVEAEEEKIEAKQVEFLMEQKIRSLPSKMISVHKSGLMVKKLMNKNNPTWSNKAVNIMESIEGEERTIPQSLPPLQKVVRLMAPPLAPPANASFNAYEYFWRNKNTVSTPRFTNNYTTNNNNHNNDNKFNGAKAYEHQDLAVRRENKSENFIPYFRGCKEGRRSLSIWEPYCIATS